jgi:hypothetical protein
MRFFSPSTGIFYSADIHGPRQRVIADPSWTRPLIAVTLQPGERYGSTVNTSDQVLVLQNEPDIDAVAPTIEVPNEATLIPADAVEITDEDHAALIAGQAQEMQIVVGAEGRPALQARPLPTHAELVERALEAARRERQPIMGVLDGLQSSALATGNGNMATLIETAKQSLRDITALDLSACVTFEAMRQAFKTRYAELVAAAPEVAIAFREMVE